MKKHQCNITDGGFKQEFNDFSSLPCSREFIEELSSHALLLIQSFV